MTVRLGSVCIISLLLVGMLAIGCGDGDSTTLRPPVYPPEYYVLQRAEVLAGSAVGFSGATPETVIAFRALLLHPAADAYFKSLVETATLPGQLYALAGVYFTDFPALGALAAPFLARDDLVLTFFGCIMVDQPVSDMAGQIVDGTFPQQLNCEAEE